MCGTRFYRVVPPSELAELLRNFSGNGIWYGDDNNVLALYWGDWGVPKKKTFPKGSSVKLKKKLEKRKKKKFFFFFFFLFLKIKNQ